MRTEEQNRQLKAMMSLSGILLTVAGATLIVFPSLVVFLGLNESDSLLLGGPLLFLGIGDFLIAKFVFKTKDRI